MFLVLLKSPPSHAVHSGSSTALVVLDLFPGFFEPYAITEKAIHIRRYLSGGWLLAIVHKRFMIRQFEDGFESQPGASRSGIPLGVSPCGIDPQVTDHSVEGPTVPGSIAMT